MQHQLGEAEPARHRHPLRALAREARPDGEERARRRRRAERDEERVHRSRQVEAGGGPGEAEHDRDDHGVAQEAHRHGAENGGPEPAALADAQDGHDQRAEDDQVGGEDQDIVADCRLPHQDRKQGQAEKAHVADGAALRLDPRFGQPQPPDRRDHRHDQVDREGPGEIGGDEGPVDQLPQGEVRGEPEEHGREREVEDELGQRRRRLGRKEPAPPRAVAQADDGEERQGLQEDRPHEPRPSRAASPPE